MSFFEELKRRNVFRVGIAYLVASWLLLQITDILVPILGLTETASKFVFLLLAIGLIPSLIFSWVFELTSEGLKKEADIPGDPAISGHTAKKLDKITIGLLIAVVGMIMLDRFVFEPPASMEQVDPVPVGTAKVGPEPIDDGTKSLAVLPFVNLSDDQQNEYFSDGISEELINILVRIKGLRVPSRTSSFTFKGSDKKVSDIGRELQVDHVLEGSVRKAGDRIRVTAQLIDVRTDTHLWSEIYTRELDDIFAVQEEIAQAIVDALRVTLTGTDQQKLGVHSTNNVEAYNKYLLGRHLWNQRTPQSILAAIEPLREAVAIDPEFDQGWAALADAYLMIPEYELGSIQDNIPLAKEATEKALAINPDSARALTASGYHKALYEYDWAAANAAFERAIALEPDYATAHQWYGEILAPQGRVNDAIRQLELAVEADPLSAIARMVLGHTFMYAQRFEEAKKHLLAANELRPNTGTILANLAFLAMFTGQYEDARVYANEVAPLFNIDAGMQMALIDAMEDPALIPEAVEIIEQHWQLGVYNKPLRLALLGEYELAMDALEAGFEAGDPYAIQMNKIFIFDPLRDNPRFQVMLKKMNLLP